jgi:class 3 adenylate cyclase
MMENESRTPLHHENENECDDGDETESLNHDNNKKKRLSMSKINQTKRFINAFIDSNGAIAFMSLLTVYALYSDDVRIIAFPPNVDVVFLALSAVAFVFFLLEILLLCWCKGGYLRRPDFNAMRDVCCMYAWNNRRSTMEWISEVWNVLQPGSFYFWLDLISTLSMVIEMPWFLSLVGVAAEGLNSKVDAGAQAANNLKVLRILRMVRLVRLAKLYKYFSTNFKTMVEPPRHHGHDSMNSNVVKSSNGDSLDIFPPGSHVGAEMSDRTTKKVIVGILVMLMGIPLLQANELTYRNEFAMVTVFVSRLLLLNVNGADNNNELENWKFSESLFVESTDCIDITYSGFDNEDEDEEYIPLLQEGRSRMQELRIDEMEVITVGDANFAHSMTAVFDITGRVREEAVLGILLTSFVIVLLGLGMVSFTKDVHNLVIVPIEHMIRLVHEISENPLGKDLSLKVDDNKKHKDDGMETTLLIRTISKIAGLMRVGFGEAGADIIGKNLNITHGADAMNLLGTGRKIDSIFGFCDVRQFTDTTECLQEEVMLFVNRIAHILHSIVVQCDGAANKNIGDAFLLTWKVNNNNGDGDTEDNNQQCAASAHNYAADKALYSFVKTMIEMSRHEDFLCNFSPRALAELYERMPGYKCRIGCGLHFGWAIEGAIGSSKKIDASYISPHVNMSETLEGATKDYGVSILMSEPFYNLLSSEAAAGCRQVDSIKKQEGDSVVITNLYTYDVDLSIDFSLRDEEKKRAKRKKKKVEGARKKVLGSNHRKTQFSLFEDDKAASDDRRRMSYLPNNNIGNHEGDLGKLPTIKTSNDFPNVWNRDEDIIQATAHFTDELRHTYETAMNAYTADDFEHAKIYFNDVLDATDGKDGPSRFLLSKIDRMKDN